MILNPLDSVAYLYFAENNDSTDTVDSLSESAEESDTDEFFSSEIQVDDWVAVRVESDGVVHRKSGKSHRIYFGKV